MKESMFYINSSILFDAFVVPHKNLTALGHLNSLYELEKMHILCSGFPASTINRTL